LQKNSEFQELVSKLTDAAYACETIDELLVSQIDGQLVENLVAEKIATIGENMGVRRLKKINGKNISMYVHNGVSSRMGKIGVLVDLSKNNPEFGRQVAMHVAASNPAALSENDLSNELIDREKLIFSEQAKESGKPENIIESMIKGRMKKYFEEITLLNQRFVINPEITVRQAADSAGVEILNFVRLEVGEGIDKKEEDFAEEVAKTING
jgi:elongation factor Ts